MWKRKILLLIFLGLLCASCANKSNTGTPTLSSLPKSTAVASWNEIPVYPGANKFSEEKTFYIYTVQDSADKVETFYNDKLTSDGWEKFNRTDMTINRHHEISLYFSKSDRIITIEILVPAQGELTTVAINLVK